jgi:hypothetical protein
MVIAKETRGTLWWSLGDDSVNDLVTSGGWLVTG